jgi:hypothetical protein
LAEANRKFKKLLAITIIQGAATISLLVILPQIQVSVGWQFTFLAVIGFICFIGAFFTIIPLMFTLVLSTSAIKYKRYRGLYTPEELENMEYTITITGNEIINKSPEYRVRGSKHAFFRVTGDTATCALSSITEMYLSPNIGSYRLWINKKYKIDLDRSEVNKLLPELYKLQVPKFEINVYAPIGLLCIFLIFALALSIMSGIF